MFTLVQIWYVSVCEQRKTASVNKEKGLKGDKVQLLTEEEWDKVCIKKKPKQNREDDGLNT